MSNLVLDDFQDVIGTLLVNHTPNTDTFGAGWVNASANILEIIDDPDLGGSETVVQVRASNLDGGGLIRSGVDDDFQVTGTIQFWGYSTSGSGYIGCRATQLGGLIDSYGVLIYPPGETIDLVKVVNGISTVLAATFNNSGFFGYNDMEVSAVGTTIEGAVTNLGETVGPVTDSSIALGQYAFISGHDRDSGGNRWRAMSAHSTVTAVVVSDSASGNDVNLPLQLNVPVADSSIETDFIVVSDIDAFVNDDANTTDSTTLNLSQFLVTDSGAANESFSVANNFPVIGDTGSGSENSNAPANVVIPDSSIVSETSDPVFIFAPNNDSATGNDDVSGIEIDLISLSENALTTESIGENITMPLLFDSGSLSETLIYSAQVFINEVLNGSETENVEIDVVNVLDPVSGIETISGNISFAVADFTNATIDIVANIDEVIPVNDVGIGVELVGVQVDIIAENDSVFATDILSSTEAVIDVPDNFLGSDVVFPPFVGHFATDQGQGAEQPDIEAVTGAQDASIGVVELPDVAASVSVSDSGVGEVVSATIETLGVAVFDTGIHNDNAGDIVSGGFVPVTDGGSISEIIGNLLSNIFIDDVGDINDPLFVYKNDQAIVNIIFSLSRTRILFSLNTDEEHNQ